ncbi:oxidoreductase [Actinomadura parmotrematis]|uniref:SDR family oxidoreductase n=1 Tax=Actinomadura parmotrematis TaxID=2864039 RepID=A0ABS7FQ17_9ACTN|nr:oxidoreductase [Actinomadura parmotrematis]MBW8482495.1 SDR family oxidoreductase [Actinomadura parmotrematis]
MGWSASDIPDLHGRRAVVTGANSGIGYHTALQLGRHGADVVLACRDAGRGEEARTRMAAAVPGGRFELASLDLADLASVRAFAAAHAGDPLDLLVNNAGVMALPHHTTADGFEMQFGTNHLGHFALTGLLLPALLAAPAPRVVTVTSGMAWTGRLRLSDPNSERRYNKWAAYGWSKLANLIFAKELDRRYEGLLGDAAHPGFAATNLQAAGPRMAGRGLEEKLMGLGNTVIAQSAASGALPTLYAAASPDARGGACYGPRVLSAWGSPTKAVMPPAANRPEAGRALWELSEDLTGVKYPV